MGPGSTKTETAKRYEVERQALIARRTELSSNDFELALVSLLNKYMENRNHRPDVRGGRWVREWRVAIG